MNAKKVISGIRRDFNSKVSEIKSNPKSLLMIAIPFAFGFWFGNHLGIAFRIGGFSAKMIYALGNTIINPIISINGFDLFAALLGGVCAAGAMYSKQKNAKKFRQGEEYGSSRFGSKKDILPFYDVQNFQNNVILTATEFLTMGKPSSIEYARNKNTLVVGGSGSGKTRFFVKPNLMQMHSSYVITDPKGTVLVDCGKMLQRGRVKTDEFGKPVFDKNGKPVYEPYKIRVFNTIDFNKSMHYNPFAYIRPETREQDILKFVEVLIANTTSQDQHGGDEFWTKAEKLLYTAYIALIITICPEEEWNFETLITFVNISECREDEENFMNAIDWAFFYLEKWVEDDWNDEEVFNEECESYTAFMDTKPESWQISLGKFAVRQYKAYKLAAGKTAKSILISCSTRLAPFSIDKVLELTRYDEMNLDKLGDELTALFVIISDTDKTFNFIVAIMYSQLFNLLCTKADNNPDGSGKLKYHVRMLLDEFANIGKIPEFEKLIATIRSREISASIVLQTKSQLKDMYKDKAETIEGNCDSFLFLGGSESTTLKNISEMLGKETIDTLNTSRTRGQSDSFAQNYQKLGKELKSRSELSVMSNTKCILSIRGLYPFFSNKYDILKHPNYCRLKDFDEKNNIFDIAAFVKNKSKCKAVNSKSDEVSIYTYEKNNKN